MNYANIKKFDVADGPGVRVSLFVSGCRHHCRDCFNEIAWSFDYGSPFTQDTEQEIMEALKPDYIQGLTLLGGEPFEPGNAGNPLVTRDQTAEHHPQCVTHNDRQENAYRPGYCEIQHHREEFL